MIDRYVADLRICELVCVFPGLGILERLVGWQDGCHGRLGKKLCRRVSCAIYLLPHDHLLGTAFVSPRSRSWAGSASATPLPSQRQDLASRWIKR